MTAGIDSLSIDVRNCTPPVGNSGCSGARDGDCRIGIIGCAGGYH
jgi:hypothetical protein